MSIKKQNLKTEQLCKVTFKVVNGNGLDAHKIKILGEFNNWNPQTEPMKKLKGGVFTQVIKLETGREYQFRYLVDDYFWENEPEADKLVPSGVDPLEYNSVIVL